MLATCRRQVAQRVDETLHVGVDRIGRFVGPVEPVAVYAGRRSRRCVVFSLPNATVQSAEIDREFILPDPACGAVAVDLEVNAIDPVGGLLG